MRVPLLCLTLEQARDRATRGHRLGAVWTERVSPHASPDRPQPLWRQRMAQPDDVRCKGLRCLRRGALRTSRVLLKPIGLGALRAMLPRSHPTVCTAPLPAAPRNGVTGPVTRKRLLTAPLEGGRRRWRFPLVLLPCCLTRCARGHGPLRASRAWPVRLPLAASWPAWPPGSSRPHGSGGFLGRWDRWSPTPCAPCGLNRPSPEALCVFRRPLEALSEATPSLRRLLSRARKCNGPPPPAPRIRDDAAPLPLRPLCVLPPQGRPQC